MYMNEMLCCICEKETLDLIERTDGDLFCKECHEKYCEHVDNETIIVANSAERIVICHDCGCEL